jgi:AhpD family alkylhydroperoxidase
VLLTISRENGCTYCMGAHSFLADNMSGVPKPVTDALRDGKPIPDERLASLSQFTRVMFTTRGRPSPDDVQDFLRAGFSERQVLEIILALAVKTLSNYSNHVFHTPLDDAFAGRRWEA